MTAYLSSNYHVTPTHLSHFTCACQVVCGKPYLISIPTVYKISSVVYHLQSTVQGFAMIHLINQLNYFALSSRKFYRWCKGESL